MTAGLLLEQELETYLKHQHLPVHHASAKEDKYQAIDLWVDGLPIQITLGTWKTQLGLSKIRAKWDWTQFQSQRRAILVVFDMNTTNKLTMFRNMVKGLAKAKKAGLTTCIVLVDDAGVQILRG
jgi:hypothetical protein